MEVQILQDRAAVAARAAQIVAAQITEKPDCVLGLPTGETPIGMYDVLSEQCAAGKLDFSRVTTFNLDEYYPIAPEHPQSYRYFMNKHLFTRVNIPMEHTHVPGGQGDADEQCRAYEQAIAAAGGIDLQVLGIGRNAHIGFNEPDIKFEAMTHKVRLDDETIRANARFFAREEDVPRYAISMGIRNIMLARRVLLLASGPEKAEAVYVAACGNVSPKAPASILQLHRDATIIADAAAAARLPEAWREHRSYHF